MKIKGGQASAAPPVGSTLGQYGVNIPAILASVTLTTLPIVILYAIGRRQLLSGLIEKGLQASQNGGTGCQCADEENSGRCCRRQRLNRFHITRVCNVPSIMLTSLHDAGRRISDWMEVATRRALADQPKNVRQPANLNEFA